MNRKYLIIITNTNPTQGNMDVLSEDIIFTYIPNSGVYRLETLIYTVPDSNSYTASPTVYITIVNSNDDPQSVNGS